MYTDWFLIRRLAQEISRRFRGARVRDAGQLDDGRFAIALWSRGLTELLCIDVFAATPVVTVEEGELPIAVEPGFVRAAAAALRGKTLVDARVRKGDRLLRLDFGARSRFGVEDGYALICELVPRFGNIVLVKGEIVVAAAKEFDLSENAVRSVRAGETYEPPPLRPGKASPMLDEAIAKRLTEDAPAEDLYLYRRDGALVQAHLVPLPQFSDLQVERNPSLLAILDEARRSSVYAQQSDLLAKRRRSLTRTLGDRERKLRDELAQIEARLREGEKREALRAEGETIYANLYELAPEQQEQAKERATKLFAAYKKAAAAQDHLERRRAEVRDALEDIAQLRWELDRTEDAQIDDVAEAVQALEPQRAPVRRSSAQRRKPLQYTTPLGSRVLVGRTPIENADLTFRVARPDDLWFHVQNQPGAHVILQRDDRQAPPEDDVLFAAALAAFHSKAKTSPKVTVDYTQRKHVRKRPSAAPGLVFYTNPRSVLVTPATP